MQVFKTRATFKSWRSTCNESTGFVPTMGNLHSGHLILVENAFKNFNTVIVSIFVNPTQFGPTEDFDRYPRTLEKDSSLLQSLLTKFPKKNLILFAPETTQEIYPTNFSTQIKNLTWANILEGAQRPGHFEGVCTVVSILLNITQPNALYLGKKDYQQLRILEKTILDLQLNVEVIAVETVRNVNGLALSSRNGFLSPAEITQAEKFPHNLKLLRNLLQDFWSSNKSWNLEQISTFLNKHRNQDLNWDYLELREQNFAPLQNNSKKLVLLGVIRINSVRLLDNIEFDVG